PTWSASQLYTTRLPCLRAKAPAPSAIYTLSLHDALPIFANQRRGIDIGSQRAKDLRGFARSLGRYFTDAVVNDQAAATKFGGLRSEEHTSELQSRENLVCRLLLEKKNTTVTLMMPTAGST